MSNKIPDGRREMGDKPTWLRPVVQFGFVLASVLLYLQFRNFVHSLAAPAGAPVAYRPPEVEGYLPISSLMSFIYLLKTGIANHVHPAGLLIFSLTLVLALLVRRGFCSWACPIGTAAEFLHKAGKKIIGRNFLMPRWLDLPLRMLKYVLLAFFAGFIFAMPVPALKEFIYGPYNRIADIKMYLFFEHASPTALQVLVVIGILSVLFKNFWCRYLCPYGALLGLISRLSPTAIRRNMSLCTNCGACSRACPNRIAVDKQTAVCTAECTACYSCVDACPVPEALNMTTRAKNRKISPLVYAVITIAAFVFISQVGLAIGYWHSDTRPEDYRSLYHIIRSIEHPMPGIRTNH